MARIGVVLLAIVIVLAAAFVPLPGLDHEMVGLAVGDLAARRFGNILAVGVVPLLLVRGLLALVVGLAPGARRVAPYVAAAVFVALTGVSAFAVAVQYEQFWPPIVESPGLRFRAISVLTLTAGAALLWWVASNVTRTGLVHGTLLVTGVLLSLSATGEAWRQGNLVALGAAPLVTLLAPAATLVPLGVVLVVLAVRPNRRWPLPIAGEVSLLSSADLVLAPLVVGALLGGAVDLALRFASVEVSGSLPIGSTTPLFVALAAAALVTRYLAAREPDERMRPGFALLAPVVPIPGLLIAGTAWLANGGPAALAGVENPYAGEATFDVELASAGRTGPRDALVLDRRLGALGIEAEVLEVGPQRIVLRLHEVGGDDAMRVVLPPSRLGFHPVEDPPPGSWPRELPAELWVTTDSVYGGPVPAGPEARSVLAVLPPPPPGTTFAAECRAGVERPMECLPRLLGPAVLDNGELESAMVLRLELGQPHVDLAFTAAGRKRFEQLTTAAVGRHIAIVVDGLVLSTPLVHEPISGGRAWISMGHGESVDADAAALAAALRSGPLGAEWTVTSVRAAE